MPVFIGAVAFSLCLPNVTSPLRADDLSSQLLDLSADCQKRLETCQKKGLLELAPVHLPRDPPGDCNHYGWPVATLVDDTIVLMHRRIPGHRRKGAGKPNDAMSYGVVLTSRDGGQTWSQPYDLRKCMKPEDRNRGGIVPLSHRFKFDEDNKSSAGYKIHLHAIGTTHDGGVVAINNHGVFRSDDRGRSWRHFSRALRDDTFPHPIVNIGPKVLDHPPHGLFVFGNWFGDGRGPRQSNKLVVLRSGDGGKSWTAKAYEAGFSQYEPAALLSEDRFLLVARDQDTVREHWQLTWRPDEPPQRTRTNMRDPRYVDTVDFCLNPLTQRYEVVRSERHHMQLWLWSIDPAEWSSGEWRRECRLLSRGGSFYREADGFHPAAAVVDATRGVQHIFFYSGHPNGPAGVFRLTRTLDTPTLAATLGPADDTE